MYMILCTFVVLDFKSYYFTINFIYVFYTCQYSIQIKFFSFLKLKIYIFIAYNTFYILYKNHIETTKTTKKYLITFLELFKTTIETIQTTKFY
jgi:hypothetical protein